jgi:hypothetical protein
MDPQLQTLVATHPDGMRVLLGHKLRQLIPGNGLRWCWPVRLDQTGNAFFVQHEDYSNIRSQFPSTSWESDWGRESLMIPSSSCCKGLNVALFLIRPPLNPAPAPAPIRVPAAPARTPGVGFQTPMPVFGADPDEQNQAFQNAVMSIVQQGSLNDLMDSIIVEYGTGLPFRAWRSKAKYLMAIYREGDRQKAHLKAGVYFLATRLNFVSADLEYLADAYIAEMSAAMQRAGAPATWTMTTVSHLEDLAREKYFDYRAKADSAVSKGHARPMFDPSQPNNR